MKSTNDAIRCNKDNAHSQASGVQRRRSQASGWERRPMQGVQHVKIGLEQYALKSKIEEELEQLQKLEVISLVRYSNWASPIVPVIKSDQHSFWLYVDYKITYNAVTLTEQYPIPRIKDIFAMFGGGEHKQTGCIKCLSAARNRRIFKKVSDNKYTPRVISV